MTAEELAALEGSSSALFSDREQAALLYAQTLTISSIVPEEVFATIRRQFSADEIVELTAVITFEICAAKFNRALEIEGQGICILRPPAK